MEAASAPPSLWESYGHPPGQSLYHWPPSADDRHLPLGDDPQQLGPSDMEPGFLTWDRTPDLGSIQQFSTFPSVMSPYASFSPYVPSHPEFQQSFAALPLGRQHSSLSSSASSSSLASSHDRHSPLECSTSHSSSSSLYLSGTLGFTPAAVPRAAPCVNPSPKVESPATDLKPAPFVASPPSGSVEPTPRSDEDHHDFFDHLFKKPVGLGFAESRLRQTSLGGAAPPSALDMSRNSTGILSEGPLSAPPLLSPSPIHPRGVRPALLARQHSLHGVDGRARSDSTFSTSSFDSNASLGLGSPLGALALVDPASPALASSQLQQAQQQPVRTVHPLAISAGPGSPAIVAPPMMASVSLSAIQSPSGVYRSPATTAAQIAPLTPRLRELQQSELGGETSEPAESRRPRSSSNPSAGRSARRHSRNGSVVLAAGGRQLQTLAALKGALEDESAEVDGGGGGGLARRRSVRGAAAEARSGMRTPPVGVSSAFDVTTPGGTVKARKTERRSGLMESIMARGSPTTADSALAAATVSTNATPTPHVAPPPPLALARSTAPTAPAAPAAATEVKASSRRRSSIDEGLSLPMDEDGAIETDADGRLICGMLLPGMTEPCRRAFKRKEHRKRHQRQHTNEKPYPCPKCGMRFTRTDNCNQHIRTHENKDGRNSKMLRERQEREAREPDFSAPAGPGQHSPTDQASGDDSPMMSYPVHQPMPVLSGPMPDAALEGYYGLGMDQDVWIGGEAAAVHRTAMATGFYG